MKLAILAVVVSSSRLAAPAYADELAPYLYEAGNLRVGVACASAFPADDLEVSIDGQPLRALRTNAITNVALTSDNTPVVVSAVTDVGYVAPPGHHLLRIAATDCAADERDIDVPASHALHIDGRLHVTTPELLGPVGAPDGWNITLGGYGTTRPALAGANTLGTTRTAFSTDSADTRGGWLSVGFERRNFVMATDFAVGGGSLTGKETTTGDFGGSSTFTGSFMNFQSTLRVGARLPLQHVALAAGGGIGANMFVTTGTTKSNDSFAVLDEKPDISLTVPVWASATVKPACDWGIQALATVDVMNDNAIGFAIGATFQPSRSCREPAGVNVSP